ncbi:MFS transporter [Amylibacter sp. IMCC11727]|uniref:MFS transporter n=1 Tax=Amylibacter sp. IMCC11727 TaxID=3039851 RepID=UPI00244E0312|nr:MFS transporter [Amylibacter sp. IMCC11727]WGI22610.1 MFS transporter [Amylibacter sp. IMCC11727]
MASGFSLGLHRYSTFAGILAAAGLPLYIHAPKFYVDQYDLSLTSIASALLGLRMLDFIQDPILGWIIDHLGPWRALFAGVMTALLAGAMVALFAIPAPINPLVWFILCLAVLFTAFSALSILFYARGIVKGDAIGDDGHVRLAGWRESGALVGICLAAILPTIFLSLGFGAPMAAFAIVFAVACSVGVVVMSREWTGKARVVATNTRVLLADPVLRQLLVVGLLNAAPAAVSSSLFLFFVEYRLGSAEAAGPLLLLFFLSAAASVPFWAKVAHAKGAKWTLMAGMLMAIVTFSFAVTLGDGDVWAFAVICLFSGAALGADMTLLPAMFSKRVKAVHRGGGQAFGLWNFCAKFTLALAAVTVLPALDNAGFSTNDVNPPQVLLVLTITYAVVPSVLKIFALAVLYWTPIEETQYV